jgi:hypothetical protein
MTTAVTTPHLPDATGVDLQDWGALESIGPAMQTRWRTLLDADASTARTRRLDPAWTCGVKVWSDMPRLSPQ